MVGGLKDSTTGQKTSRDLTEEMAEIFRVSPTKCLSMLFISDTFPYIRVMYSSRTMEIFTGGNLGIFNSC